MKVLAMVAVLVLAAGAVQAQDICEFSDEVNAQATKFVSKPVVRTDGISQAYDRFRGGVADLCRIKPTEAEFEAGEADVWLMNADVVASNLADGVFTNMLPPQTAGTLNRLRILAHYVGTIQNILRPRRVQAYQAVRVETKERVVQVRVPADCPEPTPAPESACTIALRQATSRWVDQMNKWFSFYEGSGDEYALAKASAPELVNLANGRGDPFPFVVGWLAQWRHIVRHQDRDYPFAGLRNGPLPQIAADMRAQLQLCGRGVPDWDRD